MCAELTKTVPLTSCTISRALFCPGEKTRPRGRRKDGIGRIPCDHLQHLEFMISGGVTAPAAQPGAGDSPKALQGHVEDPGSFRGHQPGTRTGQRRCQTRPKSECPPRCSRAQGEQTLPGVCQAAEMELKLFAKPGLHWSLCWHTKQLSGESRSHLHFKVTQDWS